MDWRLPSRSLTDCLGENKASKGLCIHCTCMYGGALDERVFEQC